MLTESSSLFCFNNNEVGLLWKSILSILTHIFVSGHCRL